MLTSAPEPLLTVAALESGYGKIRVLHGIDFAVSPGEVVALLGPNGAGKTTMLRALSGLLPVNAGHVRFGGRDITNATPREAARAGLVHVIEGHRVFTQNRMCSLLGLGLGGIVGGFIAAGERISDYEVLLTLDVVTFITFAGVLIGPPLFGAIASATGSYGSGFLAIAALPLLAGAGLLASGRGSAGRG